MTRRIIAILWAVLGFVGLGILIGYLWLDQELDRTQGPKPTVQFVGPAQGARSECPPLPRSVDELSRAIRKNPETDFRMYIANMYRCARDGDQRVAFLAMLKGAARRGDGFAERSLEVIVRDSCATISAVVLPTNPKDEPAEVECVALTMQAAAPNVDVELQRRVLRIAEIHALIAAEVAGEELQQLFCAEVELVPAEVLERLSDKHSALAATITALCRVDAPSDNAGANE